MQIIFRITSFFLIFAVESIAHSIYAKPKSLPDTRKKMNDKKRLSVYKASAGSGKTYRLAVEYIKIVLRNPENYRNILAVTFTNKATEEMKQRILTHLYGIANALPDSESYLDTIRQEVSLSDVQIRERAGQALHLLLHNYHYFRIETIDSFFQRIFRNLAHELQLSANLRIELNDRQIEQAAVDSMIDELKQNDKLLIWIIKFISEKISEDKSWNVIRSIKKFGENIFKQVYKANAKSLSLAFHNEDEFDEYRRQLYDISLQAKEKMTRRGNEFFKILEENGLQEDCLSGKQRGIWSYFNKLREGTFDDTVLGTGNKVENHINDAEKWVAKSNKQYDTIMQLVDTTLQPLLADTEKERQKLARLAMSATMTLNHLAELRLLEYIEREVRESNHDAGRFLLSDTQDLLNKLIDNSDSPFIFEKIGTRMEHIMIDEFQDTSSVQWKNFKVLLNECMSHSHSSNLIVGDVKQSIYRWRDGDWQLLNNIKDEFPYYKDEVEITPLDVNFRSDKRVVEFNNVFFEHAAETEFQQLKHDGNNNAELIKEAYPQAELKKIKAYRESKSGYVGIELLSKTDYQQTTLDRIVSLVSELLEAGASPDDIAILTRYNAQIAQIAEYMMACMPEVPIVSDEAFHISSSPTVKLIIDILHYISHSDDYLTKVNIAKTYQKTILGRKIDESNIIGWSENIDEMLPKEFTDNIDEIRNMPLYEMAEYIYKVFDMHTVDGQGAYICAFFDELQEYLADNISDIDSFIKTWNESLYKNAIQIDEANGVHLLTIHRSKGLEYNHVILPFCDWETEKRGETLWCKTDVQPFARLPIIPISLYEKQMKGSVYAESYNSEHLQNIIDNLNLLYVAFTRAGKTLNVIGQKGKTTGRSKLLESVLQNINGMFDDASYIEEEETTTFSWGEKAIEHHKKENDSKNVFIKGSISESLNMESYSNRTSFKESNASRRFVSEDKNKYIETGTILHNMLAEIYSISDIENVLRKYENDGILSATTISARQIENILRKSFSHSTIKSWFTDDCKVFAEQTIITRDDDGKMTEYRPDRVIKKGEKIIVVDYKFGKPNSKYQEQVRNYMGLLTQMGHSDIEGYIWYVYQQRIEEVKP